MKKHRIRTLLPAILCAVLLLTGCASLPNPAENSGTPAAQATGTEAPVTSAAQTEPEGTAAPEKTSGTYLFAVTDQKNSRVCVYDLANTDLSSRTAVWKQSYSAYNIADTRLRLYKGGKVVLAAYGSASASMVDYDTGKTLWFTDCTANNPHAAELIPCGEEYVIAVASSNGSEIRFFLPSGGDVVGSVQLNDAHGVLWDPEKSVLWAQGLDVLTAYRITLDGRNVKAEEATELRAKIPTSYAHDLQPYYGDTDKLWVTTAGAVYVYSKSAGTFSVTYPGASFLNMSNVKGIGNFPDGTVLYIRPDGAFKSWTSATVFFLTDENGILQSSKITSPDGGYYKVRVWSSDYQ